MNAVHHVELMYKNKSSCRYQLGTAASSNGTVNFSMSMQDDFEQGVQPCNGEQINQHPAQMVKHKLTLCTPEHGLLADAAAAALCLLLLWQLPWRFALQSVTAPASQLSDQRYRPVCFAWFIARSNPCINVYNRKLALWAGVKVLRC